MRKAIIFLLLSFLASPLIFADGMIHIRRLDAWELHRENQQAAVIGYRNGYEKMLITVGLDEKLRGTKAVWIFPIPARPEKATLDIVKEFPHFGWGQDIDSAYRNAVVNTAKFIAGYSTFPVSLFFVPFFIVMAPPPSMAPRGAVPGGVTIHERIVAMGLTTELVTTEKQEALARYLADRGLNLPSVSASILDWYIGKKYSLVVSYISDVSEFKKARQDQTEGPRSPTLPPELKTENSVPIGLLIGFPTDKIFFPLKPTSVYGELTIPITVYVQGHVTPELYPRIKGLAKVTYYLDDSGDRRGLESVFIGWNSLGSLKYTEVGFLAPSSSLVDDLWLNDVVPTAVGTKVLLRESSPLWGVALYVVFSILASVWAGKVCFRRPSASTRRLAQHGLWNLGTSIAFLLKTREFSMTKASPVEAQANPGQASRVKTKWDSRKISYVLLFYLFFFGLATFSAFLLLAVLR